MGPLPSFEIHAWVRAALAEDLGAGDLTTLATVPEDARATARMVARQDLVLAGIGLAVAAFQEISPATACTAVATDGARLRRGETLLAVEGPARALLTAERVALNFVQHLSGIATLTAAFVDAVRDTGARVLDTRKTTPGWRRLEKYAVACGGGVNHRQRLDDLLLIKDNHLCALRREGPDPIALAVERARNAHPYLKVEVEADTLDQVRQALNAGADIVLLDNMSLEDLRTAVALCRGRALTEASGGLRLANARDVAATGVDFLSVGALTHSAPAVDIALDFEP